LPAHFERGVKWLLNKKTGAAATVAIILAIAGIISVFIGHPVWAFLVELAAVAAGAIGFFMAASPRVSGGLMSIVAIIIALLGLGLAVLAMLGALVF
jgi:hypothetical protein